MSASLGRARLLLAHERYNQAEREIRGCLAENPNDVAAHYLLALCLREMERLDEALAEAQMAVHLAPDEPLPYFELSRVLISRDQYREAARAIDEAIRLDPYDADYHATKAAIHYDQRQWQPALDAAEAGLEIDPEHAGSLNLRAMALVNLGRKGEAGASLAVSLQKNPHDAVTHANQGWTLLHARKPTEAMEHFREALRLDPSLDWARMGILEAIKARNVVYRWMLVYFLWMARLSPGVQWGIILGMYFVNKFAGNLARKFPDVAPYTWPIVGLYLAFALMTWLAYPIFNLMLRLHPLGKHALARDQILGANCVGSCLAIGFVLAIIGFATGWTWALIAAMTSAALALPAAATFQCEPGSARNIMGATSFGLALIGLAASATAFHSEDAAWAIAAVFLIGIVASSWVANFLTMRGK